MDKLPSSSLPTSELSMDQGISPLSLDVSSSSPTSDPIPITESSFSDVDEPIELKERC